MSRTRIIIAAGAAVALTTIVFSAIHLPLRKKYNELSAKLPSPVFTAKRIDSATDAFLGMVIESWNLKVDESPDSAWAAIADTIGFSSDVEGLLSFFTHEVKPYSYLDTGRNAREGAIAAALAVMAPVSTDGFLHVRDDLAFIRLADRAVLVYSNSPEGLRSRIFMKPAS